MSTTLTVQTYAEMATRPEFTDRLDKTLHVPQAILANYDFNEEVPCGLLGCFEPHKHGIHFVCIGGAESNMGNNCAQRHFPDQYDAMRKSFKVVRDHRAGLNVIEAYRARRDALQTTIDELWNEERGARWAHECDAVYRNHCPRFVKDQIIAMAKSGDWNIYDYRTVASGEGLGLGYRRDELTERVILGTVRGGNAIKVQPYVILKDLRERMSKYDALSDAAAIGAKDRLNWNQWISTIDSKLDDARKLLTEARTLYDASNLAELLKIAREAGERKAVRMMIDSIKRVELIKRRRAS